MDEARIQSLEPITAMEHEVRYVDGWMAGALKVVERVKRLAASTSEKNLHTG